MSSLSLDWIEPAPASFWAPREARSGLTGFGSRPSLHPAWREDGAEIVALRPQSRRPGPTRALALAA